MKKLNPRNIVERLPAYWWTWLGLTLVLIGLVVWVQVNLIPPSPTPVVSIILPTRTLPPKPTPVVTIEPLDNFVEIAILEMTPAPEATATPTDRPTPTPTPIFVFHPVKSGETLISIAAEYGISTEALLAANNIRDPANLEVGQALLIPPQDGLRVPVVPHTVAAGDSLLSIAAKYGSSVKKILAANPHLKADSKLPVGETIAVPVVFTEPKPVAPVEGSDEPVYYTVAEGDTPLAIAYEYNIPVELLLAANEITDPTLLQVGDQLLIPPSEGLTQGVPIILYDLAEGDTLLGLASKFGSSVKDILAVNPELIPSSLEVGQTVAIPVIFAPPRPTPSPQQPKATPKPIAPPPSLVEMEQQMVAGVNAQREAAGLPPYQVDEEIAAMALKHAQDMVVRGYFGHVTPEGNTLQDRFFEAEINAANVGEDIQRNTRPANETVDFALNWFMNSRPHRANILHPHHNRIGVGIVEGPPGWYTYVLVFAQR